MVQAGVLYWAGESWFGFAAGGLSNVREAALNEQVVRPSKSPPTRNRTVLFAGPAEQFRWIFERNVLAASLDSRNRPNQEQSPRRHSTLRDKEGADRRQETIKTFDVMLEVKLGARTHQGERSEHWRGKTAYVDYVCVGEKGEW